jgi:hypothetical protein
MAMARKPDQVEPPQGPAEFAKMGEAQTEAVLAAQQELLKTYEQISRAWMARAKEEVDLWTELANKVSGLRSLPEALEAYQQCLAQRMQMAASDGQRLFQDSQKIMNAMTRSATKGFPTGGG